jgi:CheY-like chemotaxis protein
MPRFLVVVGEINALSALRELLESDGHQVAAFSSAPEAIAALRESTFDAILADLEMPQARGDAVVRLARKHQPEVCAFVTAARRVPRGFDEVCHAFEKPLDYEQVTRTVAACRANGGSKRHGGCYIKSRSTLKP